MRLFIINAFQSAADQLYPENDKDRCFFCLRLTLWCRLMYFTIIAAWKKGPYVVEDGLSGFYFECYLELKKNTEKASGFDSGCLAGLKQNKINTTPREREAKTGN